jgi:hypothetical protein
MVSSGSLQLTIDFLPITFFMDFSQNRFGSTVFAQASEKEITSSFTSLGLVIGKNPEQADWLVIMRLELTFVVFSINLKVEGKN